MTLLYGIDGLYEDIEDIEQEKKGCDVRCTSGGLFKAVINMVCLLLRAVIASDFTMGLALGDQSMIPL